MYLAYFILVFIFLIIGCAKQDKIHSFPVRSNEIVISEINNLVTIPENMFVLMNNQTKSIIFKLANSGEQGYVEYELYSFESIENEFKLIESRNGSIRAFFPLDNENTISVPEFDLELYFVDSTVMLITQGFEYMILDTAITYFDAQSEVFLEIGN